MIKKLIKSIKFKKKMDKHRKSIFIENSIKAHRKKRKLRAYLNLNSIEIDKKKLSKFYIVFAAIIPIIIVSLFVSPVFSIKKVNIIKSDSLTDINIAYKSIEDIRGKSIFLLDRKEISKSLESYQKNVKVYDIDIILPDTIKILLWSEKGLFNTKIWEKNYIIVENWVLVPSKSNKKLKNLKIIWNIKNKPILDYKKVFEWEYIKNIANLLEWLEKNIIWLKIKLLSYYVLEREIHLFLENETRLIFDLTENTEKQVEKIVIFNKENFNLVNKRIFYVDARIREKIFYCPMEEELTCKNNIKRIYSE